MATMVQAARSDDRPIKPKRSVKSKGDSERKKRAELEKAFEARYWRKWKNTSRLVRSASKDTCCWCLINKATQAHHTLYFYIDSPVAEKETPGINCFGVCDDCHEVLHTSHYWIKDRINPALGNRNTQEAIDRLEFGFKILSGSTYAAKS